jgi:hypothetical protein
LMGVPYELRNTFADHALFFALNELLMCIVQSFEIGVR